MKLYHIEGRKFTVLLICDSDQECYEWACLLQLRLNTTKEKKVVAITNVEPTDTTNRIQIRAYDLVENESHSDEYIVQTDYENIKPFENLPDQENFIDDLKNVEKVNTVLYYKELPVNGVNKIISLDSDSITLTVSEKQIIVANKNGVIYFETNKFGFVKAYIKSIDSHNRSITLHNFIIGKYFPTRRTKFRVQAEDNVQVTIVNNELTFDGALFNLNEKYIAITTKKKNNLFEGSLISIEMMLNTDKGLEHFTTTATVQKLQNYADEYKVVLMCHLDSRNKVFLSNYIAKRQRDIIKEMKSKSIL